MKKIKWLNHKWYVMGKSDLGDKYIKLKRVSIYSDLKKFGRVASVINTAKSDLEKNNINYK